MPHHVAQLHAVTRRVAQPNPITYAAQPAAATYENELASSAASTLK